MEYSKVTVKIYTADYHRITLSMLDVLMFSKKKNFWIQNLNLSCFWKEDCDKAVSLSETGWHSAESLLTTNV